MNQQLIECVPNFSEGRDPEVIRQITRSIESVPGIRLLDVDPGKATNRTVVTFVGAPEAVIEAAFQGIRTAAELIDMRNHTGAHPRQGATDVCPLIPVSGITMEETIHYAHKLAARVGEELKIPVYLYESAARVPARKNLAYVRSGEYEALADKLHHEEWRPDFGPPAFNAKAGATAVGARDFLVAYNVNLNTTSSRRANSVAFDVREKGRVMRDGHPINGKPVLDDAGNKVYSPGACKHVKAIGWYIEEYGIAQISMNLTNIRETPLHEAFEACRESATRRGLRVTGSELVGLVPLKVLTDAGKYYLTKQRRSLGVSEAELIRIAVRSLGLDELSPFDPKQKIIEYCLRKNDDHPLLHMTLEAFANETASESPAPGGGSISAYVGALGVALGSMVANLSSHKRSWDDRWEEFSKVAEKAQAIKSRLLYLVDEDTHAFNEVMAALRLPNGTVNEKEVRQEAIKVATRKAIEVPLQVMETAYSSMELLASMAEKGNPNSVSDAAVGALCVKAAIHGAYLNVRINTADFSDKEFVDYAMKKAVEIMNKAGSAESKILKLVEEQLES